MMAENEGKKCTIKYVNSKSLTMAVAEFQGNSMLTLPKDYAKECNVSGSAQGVFIFPFPVTIMGYHRIAEKR